MTRIIGAPDRYIQVAGETGRLHKYGSRLGTEFPVAGEGQTMASMRGLVEQALGDGHTGHEEEED